MAPRAVPRLSVRCNPRIPLYKARASWSKQFYDAVLMTQTIAARRHLTLLTAYSHRSPYQDGRSQSTIDRWNLSRRTFADLKPTDGKSQADLLIEELQELYEMAKDEFEIATESTNNATIYAASDRESARDALDHLKRVYTLYTEMTTSSASDTPAGVESGESAPAPKEPVLQNAAEQIQAGRSDPLVSGDPASGAPMFGEPATVMNVTPNYNPEEIDPAVKEEVKRRIGQRIRELQAAVENLEETARNES
ncbi:hypothetical protein VTN49DRAFT_4354 [Thermomyces lanuginosus]|uniref:uncharacterized protein n=1 Tax=Thermomyces lanuginosus TaxID=5541 RepID=UPI0037447C64